MGIAWPPPILDHQVFLSAIKLKENSGEIQRDSLTQTWTPVLRVQLDSCEKWGFKVRNRQRSRAMSGSTEEGTRTVNTRSSLPASSLLVGLECIFVSCQTLPESNHFLSEVQTEGLE